MNNVNMTYQDRATTLNKLAWAKKIMAVWLWIGLVWVIMSEFCDKFGWFHWKLHFLIQNLIVCKKKSRDDVTCLFLLIQRSTLKRLLLYESSWILNVIYFTMILHLIMMIMNLTTFFIRGLFEIFHLPLSLFQTLRLVHVISKRWLKAIVPLWNCVLKQVF